MYYGEAEEWGLSDLAAAEMGQLGAAPSWMYASGQAPVATAPRLAPGAQFAVDISTPGTPRPMLQQPGFWSEQNVAQIAGGISDVARTVAQGIQQMALIKHGRRMPDDEALRQAIAQLQAQQPGGAQQKPQWLTPVLIGGAVLGGLALFMYLRKKNGASNPPGKWHTIGD